MATAEFQHALFYPDNHDIPLSDIAATLLAHERLLPMVGDVLEALIPGLTVENSSIKLNYLRQGSLDEAFFVALLLIYQEDITRSVGHMLEQIPGQPVPEGYDALVTVIIVALLYTGARFIVEKARSARAPATATPN
ncbi:MAG: hypothetical protein U1E24_04980, partial [Phenylobacterium sp.]|nr:hypothetical protein [Phenylobacterium sp.]